MPHAKSLLRLIFFSFPSLPQAAAQKFLTEWMFPSPSHVTMMTKWLLGKNFRQYRDTAAKERLLCGQGVRVPRGCFVVATFANLTILFFWKISLKEKQHVTFIVWEISFTLPTPFKVSSWGQIVVPQWQLCTSPWCLEGTGAKVYHRLRPRKEYWWEL